MSELWKQIEATEDRRPYRLQLPRLDQEIICNRSRRVISTSQSEVPLPSPLAADFRFSLRVLSRSLPGSKGSDRRLMDVVWLCQSWLIFVGDGSANVQTEGQIRSCESRVGAGNRVTTNSICLLDTLLGQTSNDCVGWHALAFAVRPHNWQVPCTTPHEERYR